MTPYLALQDHAGFARRKRLQGCALLVVILVSSLTLCVLLSFGIIHNSSLDTSINLGVKAKASLPIKGTVLGAFDNDEAVAEEQEAMATILGNDFMVDDYRRWTVNVSLKELGSHDKFKEESTVAKLKFGLPEAYPEIDPPKVDFDDIPSQLEHKELNQFCSGLPWEPGVWCVYDWVVQIRRMLRGRVKNLLADAKEEDRLAAMAKLQNKGTGQVQDAGFEANAFQEEGKPKILFAKVFEEKKIKLQVFISTVRAKHEVDYILQTLETNEKFRQIQGGVCRMPYGYFFYDWDTNLVSSGNADNEEHGAGEYIQKMLETSKTNNMFVAVARWHGGVIADTTGDRQKIALTAIGRASREFLVAEGFMDADQLGKEKKKKQKG